jgi:hypothetical protein
MRYRPYRAAGKPQNPIVKNDNLVSRIESVINENGHNERTTEFLTSIHAFAQKKGGLTKAQLSYFEKIESAFTPEAKKAREDFASSMTEQDWKHWRIALAYYEKQGQYFQDVVRSAKDPKFVPSEKLFSKIVKNGYAQKVIASTESKPKYANNDLVTLRAGVRSRDFKLRRLIGTPCIVIKSDHRPVTDAFAGAKPYLILPFGASDAIEVTERDIKKTK